MHFWSWTPAALSLGVILINSTQFWQTESATISQLFTLWSQSTPKPLPRPVGKINPVISKSGSKPVVDYGFKGTTYDRTESSLYPTTPREDTEFEKWEEQEEAKYAQKVLLHKLKLAHQRLANKVPVPHSNDDALIPSVEAESGTEDDIQPQLAQLSSRQELTDNEKIVASFFGNQNPPKKQEPLFPNFKFPQFSQTFPMRDRMSPVIESLKHLLGTGTTALGNSTGISNKSSSTPSPLLMNIINSIRIPTMSPDGGAKFQAQMQKLSQNLQDRNILGALNQTVNIATPILLTDPVPLRSVLTGIANFVRCNTLGRLNNGNNICR